MKRASAGTMATLAAVLLFVLPLGASGATAFTVTSTIASGQRLAGSVAWSASVSGIATADIASVVFTIDGGSKWTETGAPYVYNGDGHTLDTTKLGNGSHTFAVVATARDGSTATASIVATVANPPTNTARPSISGTAVEKGRLDAVNGSWSGFAPIAFAYAWQRCDSSGGACAAIAGATGSAITLGAADVGHRLRVVVTASNGGGSTAATSSATATVRAAAPVPANTSQPSISGSARDGSLLTASHGGWSNSPRSYAYQWQRCDSSGGGCVSIGGATGTAYTVTTSDVGHRLRVAVVATNDAGSAAAVSNPTGVVVATGSAPANLSGPSISGPAKEGSQLGADRGRWSGDPAPTFAFQWQRCDASGGGCADIAGATGAAYGLTSSDVSRTIRVKVVATNSRGSTLATSRQTGLVAPARPSSGTVPVSQVSLPQRLVIDRVSFSPTRIRTRSPIVARFHVSDTRGFAVQGALVYALGIPYGWVRNASETATDRTGWATVVLLPTRALPLRRGASLVLFVRARKAGDDILAGVSARRLVQVSVR